MKVWARADSTASIVGGSISSAKESLRYCMLVHRCGLTSAKRMAIALVLKRVAPLLLKVALCNRGRILRRGMVIAGYWPLAGEVDIRPLLLHLWVLGYRVVLPVVVGRERPLIFRGWHPSSIMELGLHGTQHPPIGAPKRVPDVVLVPLLAFDRSGFRLGFGAGYYDRTLAFLRRQRKEKIIAIGIGFANQMVLRVPRYRFDAALDLIWYQ